MSPDSRSQSWLTRALDVVYAALAAAMGLEPWWPLLSSSRALDLSILAVHRSAGDLQYFPLIAGLSELNLGENMALESYGSGIRSFPLAALIGHAVFIRCFGEAGWILADAAVMVCYFLLGRRLLKLIGLSARSASLLSIVLLFGAFSDGLAPLNHGNLSFGLFPTPSIEWSVSPLRVPRPYVTWLFTLFALSSILQLCLPEPHRPRRSQCMDAALAGVALAGLAQADIYAAAAVMPGLTGMLLVWFANEIRQPNRRADLFKRTLILFGAAALLFAPFVIQRIFEHPDVPRRFGVIRVPRKSATLTPEIYEHMKIATVCALVSVLPLLSAPIRRSAVRRRALLSCGCLFVVAASGAAAQPLFVYVTGTAVQDYHFGSQFLRIFGVALAVGVSYAGFELLRVLATRARRFAKVGPPRADLLAGWAALVCCVAVSSAVIGRVKADYRRPISNVHTRADFYLYRELGNRYLRDFQGLARELTKRAQDGLHVLATLDIELAVWWVVFRKGALLNPDPSATPLPDIEIERRLAALGAALQLDESGFIRLITQGNDPKKNDNLGQSNIFTVFFLSNNKYGGGPTGWHLRIPEHELVRLGALYLDERAHAHYRLDGIVLFSRGSLADLTPDPERFVKVFENATFRLYTRSAPAA